MFDLSDPNSIPRFIIPSATHVPNFIQINHPNLRYDPETKQIPAHSSFTVKHNLEVYTYASRNLCPPCTLVHVTKTKFLSLDSLFSMTASVYIPSTKWIGLFKQVQSVR